MWGMLSLAELAMPEGASQTYFKPETGNTGLAVKGQCGIYTWNTNPAEAATSTKSQNHTSLVL